MSTEPTQDDAKALTITADPKELALFQERQLAVKTELQVIVEGLEVAFQVRDLAPEYTARRDLVTTTAYRFTKPPTTDEEQEQILIAQRAVAKLRTELGKKIDGLKSPLNAVKDKILDLHKVAEASLKKCELHCQGLVNFRQEKLKEARLAAEEAAARESKRIADESAAAERAQLAAEEARKAAELAQQQAEAAKGKAKANAEAEAARLAAEASRLEDEAMEKGMAAEAAPEPVIAPVSDLPMARTITDFELRGRTPSEKKASLIELLNAHPLFWTAHISETTPRGFSLTLKIADLTDALAGREPFKKLESVPGINITTRLSQLR